VVFITHDPRHAHAAEDRFLLLDRGGSVGDFAKGEVSGEELTRLMAGGAELDELTTELERADPQKGRGQPSSSPVRVTRTRGTGEEPALS
jgi:simple sugar transport system ATP-binding protein